MEEAICTVLDQGGTVVLAGLGLWLIKVVVNDLKHDLEATRKGVCKIAALLEEIRDDLKKG